jgi:hypothetical protein
MHWLDSNPDLFVPEADAMSTAPRRQAALWLVIKNALII